MNRTVLKSWGNKRGDCQSMIISFKVFPKADNTYIYSNRMFICLHGLSPPNCWTNLAKFFFSFFLVRGPKKFVSGIRSFFG